MNFFSGRDDHHQMWLENFLFKCSYIASGEIGIWFEKNQII